MSKIIRISDEIYIALGKIKESEDKSSIDEVIRLLIKKSGLTEFFPSKLEILRHELKEAGINENKIKRLEELLRVLYYGKYLHTDGVLEEDLKNMGFDDLFILLGQYNLAKPHKYYKNNTWKLTHEGEEIGAKIVDEIIINKSPEIEEKLNKIHPKLLALLILYFEKSWRCAYPLEGWPKEMIAKEYPLHVVGWEQGIINQIENIISVLKKFNLGTEIRDYVGAGPREKHFATAPEVIEYLKQCLKKRLKLEDENRILSKILRDVKTFNILLEWKKLALTSDKKLSKEVLNTLLEREELVFREFKEELRDYVENGLISIDLEKIPAVSILDEKIFEKLRDKIIKSLGGGENDKK